ncbi:MAG: rod shape-determining protein MreD [Anaerolineae bacterium]|nr:rod shape-determining protein MreD [Anaerolineae bacterium]
MAKANRRRTLTIRRGLTNVYLMAVVLTLVVLVQATLLARVRLIGATPNLLLVVVVCWSLIRGLYDGLVWGFVGGLALDVLAGLPLGTSSLALMATTPLAGLGKNSVFPGSLTLPILLVALATPVYGWVVLLSEMIRGIPVDWLASTVRIIGPEIAFNAALTVIAYPALRWLATHYRPTQMEW